MTGHVTAAVLGFIEGLGYRPRSTTMLDSIGIVRHVLTAIHDHSGDWVRMSAADEHVAAVELAKQVGIDVDG